MQKLTPMFNIFVGIFLVGCLYDFENPKHTHKHAAAPQRTTDHGDRGGRGSSGSFSANGPGGCLIFSEFLLFCVCARGGEIAAYPRYNIWRRSTASRSQPRCQPEIGTKHPFIGGFSDLGNCQNRHSSPHAVYTGIILREFCTDEDLWSTLGYHKQWPKAGANGRPKVF